MILIPEIETVLILVPRTGSGSLRRAVAERYPQSMLIYRHMEADGVPAGYDHWQRVGFVRHPVARLWSLYKFMFRLTGDSSHHKAMLRSVNRFSGFEDWLLNNETPFTDPYDSEGRGSYFPQYAVRHPIPENRKSQFVYLRPDLGTKVITFDKLHAFADELDLSLGQHNKTSSSGWPELSGAARAYVERVFAWDLNMVNGGVR